MKQCKRKLFTLKNCVGRKWGLNARKIMWIYKMVVLPKLLYGSVVWFTGTESTVIQSKLDSLQRLAMVIMSGCMRSTPTRSLEIIFGLPPLELVIRERAISTASRFKDEVDWCNWDGIPSSAKRKSTFKILHDEITSMGCNKQLDGMVEN